jgi:hypothetical protein
MAILFGGLLNLVAIDRGGSKFSKSVGVFTSVCVLFCFALPILNEPQVYVGIIIFLIPAIAFSIDLAKKR